MAKNYGKEFEAKFKADFLKIPGVSIDRLYDVMNGHKSIKQISDFIVYLYPNIFYLECKSHRGNSFPISNLTQFDKLKDKIGIPGVRTGVILWLIDKDIVMYVPTATVAQMKADGKKSIASQDIKSDKYRIIQIPSIKLRVFMDSDYTVLTQLNEGD